MLQTKEQVKNLRDQINEDEIGKLPEKKFRVMIVNMIQNLGNRMEKIQETYNKVAKKFIEVIESKKYKFGKKGKKCQDGGKEIGRAHV